MKFFSKTMTFAFTAIALMTAPVSLRAAYFASNDSCYDPCDEAQFSFGADFLWLKPCLSNLDYAAESVTSTVGRVTTTEMKYHNLKTDWEPGVRVYFGVPSLYYDWNMKGSWTYFKLDDKNSISGTNLLTPFLHPSLISDAGRAQFSSISASRSLEYHEFDMVFSVPFEFCTNHYLEPFFGANGLLLREKFNIEATNAVQSSGRGIGRANWHSNVWGVGLIMGTHYQFYIDDGFKFHSKASASLLAGSSGKVGGAQELTDGITVEGSSYVLNLKESKDGCEFFPGLHIQTGLSYENDLCGVEYGIHVGYEFKSWWNLSEPRRFVSSNTDVDAHSTSSTNAVLGIHGLFAGMEFKF